MPETAHFRVRFEARHGWTVRRDGRTSHLSAHGTQAGAERTGRALAQRERALLSVYGFDGDLIRSETYASLPS